VQHKIFGAGKVLATLKGDIVQVLFDNAGCKKIAANYLSN
jgi:hypothetical protein